MPLTSFRIENIKAIKLAECTAVPPIMVIAGPNGVGKSTLLHQISRRQGTQQSPDAKFIYQPPHRAVRRTSVRRRFLMGGDQATFLDRLSRPEVSGFEGFNIQFPARTPDNVDETGSTIKYAMGRIENRRQTALSNLVDKALPDKRSIETSEIPDVYQPLRELTRFLLPHLAFSRIDFKNEDDVKCLWRRNDANQNVELDIDDLSSGEKAIIVLFLPLLEADINRRLGKITEEEVADEVLDLVFIIDEPELHLHPDLQSKILSYIRSNTASGVQFILSTHSPTLLDQTYDEELFLMRSPGEEGVSNQLQKVATNIERLEALKDLTGNTFVVTTGRSIVCTEGVPDHGKTPSDLRLLSILYPRATAFTLVPVGGKGSVIQTVQKLREFLPEEHFGVKVFGLVDRDQSAGVLPDGLFELPLSMIENFLLDASILFEYLVGKEILTFPNVEAVASELITIAESNKSEEIALRVSRRLKAHTVRIKGSTLEEVKSVHEAELGVISTLLPSDEDLTRTITEASEEVEACIRERKVLQDFRGKPILKEFFRRHLGNSNTPYSRFCYEIAQEIAIAKKAEPVLNPLFDRLN